MFSRDARAERVAAATTRSARASRLNQNTMPTIFEGSFAPPPGRFALGAARFNNIIVDQLVAGALDALKRHGVADDAVDLVRVPGSLEIPVVAKCLAELGSYAAIICLGAVIRGDTGHY